MCATHSRLGQKNCPTKFPCTFLSDGPHFKNVSDEAQFFTAANFTMRSERCTLTPHVRKSKTVLDSGFHLVDTGFQVLESLMGF